jgi:hypothetical protein
MSYENELYYDAWSHSSANTEPAGNTDENILGLELEIAEVYDYSGLNQMIEDGYIETSDGNDANIQLEVEDDGNIEYEVIFNADTKENILNRLSRFNRYYHEFYTFEGCSAHIHLNRKYLNQCGLWESDILKAAESITPILYAISGRDSTYLNRWCNPLISISEYSFLERFKHIDNVTADYGDRYHVLNCCNRRTLELRIFSNNCNFDYNTINMFLSVASELLINIALIMKNRSYSDPQNIKEIINTCKEFFNNHFGWAIEYYNLNRFFNIDNIKKMERVNKTRKAQRRLKNLLNNDIWEVGYYINRNENNRAAQVLLRIMQNNPELNKITQIDLNNLNPCIEILEAAAYKDYLRAVMF